MIDEETLFSQLNPEQKEAVIHLTGPLLVVAGAGSGKTRTLVYRVARLIQIGVEPSNILLLTFTRKAAFNMLTRAAELVGPVSHEVQGGTFHGFSNKMLRKYANFIGYNNDFTILDVSDVQSLISIILKDLGIKKSESRLPKITSIINIFGKCASHSKGLEEILDEYYPHLMPILPTLVDIYNAYKEYKKRHGLVDYDDLLELFKTLLITREDICNYLSERFKFIMVDEYQDTNLIQAQLIRLLSKTHDNVMVVGDDAQSIYSFRGANFKNILEFPKLFPGTKIIKLERNYRTTQPNLDCTNAIIAHAKEKFTKHLRAVRTGGNKPYLYKAIDEKDQAQFVASQIEQYIKDGIAPSEIAVLFRAAYHSFQLETELNLRGIKFIKRGGLRLTESAHIKDVLSVLRIIFNPQDILSWNRALQLIPNIGPKTIEKIMAEILTSDEPFEALVNLNTRAKWKTKLLEFANLLKTLADKDIKISDMLSKILKWYQPYLESYYVEDFPKRRLEIEQLIALSNTYSDGNQFLADISLDPPDTDELDEQGKICLSTIHSAKGLEWKVVFIISLAEGRLPSLAASSDEEIEEERRLFYVAATRAKDDLYFCYPQLISIGSYMQPSSMCRFLKEIPSPLLKLWSRSAQKISQIKEQNKINISNKKHYSVSLEKQRFPVGCKVRHSVFGIGCVIETIGSKKVKVLFDSVGERVLHLEFAKLSKI